MVESLFPVEGKGRLDGNAEVRVGVVSRSLNMDGSTGEEGAVEKTSLSTGVESLRGEDLGRSFD